ncbi:alpha/beta hydrolase [Streptomyces hoynatensis]|uniref:alpha/beta hydrolase n=1 Tax=Streptomyces hoynatensis TaxID=1141874 RepID=UPI001F4DCBDF|nr:alpha/beta hydrolase [Streptomyces hoynatensis]
MFLVLVTAGWIVSGAAASPDVYELQLGRWERASLAGRPLPSPDAPPERIAGFFAGLTAGQREGLARDYPLVVGNLPGAPVSLRYRANRRALAEARDAERERMHDERLSATGQREAGRLMHRFESMLAPGRQILSFDPTGRGRAAEVFGDLATARRISLVVPGVDTELLTFEKTQRKYTAPSGMAEALYQEEQALGPGESTAVIAWADYETPPGLGMSAATAHLAGAGADRLLAAVAGLPGRAPVSLFCHSYGSVVCGVAAPDLPARVTDIAVAGSPGMRASDVADLETGARVWAMRDEDDWIGEVPHLEIGPFGHGNDPYDADFGARLLSSEGAEGHSGYFTPGADSLRNMALIGAGSVNEVSCAPGVESCAPLDPCALIGGL